MDKLVFGTSLDKVQTCKLHAAILFSVGVTIDDFSRNMRELQKAFPSEVLFNANGSLEVKLFNCSDSETLKQQMSRLVCISLGSHGISLGEFQHLCRK